MPQTRTLRIQNHCINNLIKLNLPSIPHINSTEPTNQLTFVENTARSLVLKITSIPSIITTMINASDKSIQDTELLYKQFNQT